MAMLEFLPAALLDPVQAALVPAVVLVWRGPAPVPVAAIAAAVASETVMALAAADYTWGEMMVPRLVSSMLQAALLCWIVGLVRPGPGAPRQQAARSSRLTRWQMRALVRRRLTWLRERKIHP
jgi:hypothetical protein